eukprot:2966218-Prymnesium_polylepis.1
MATVRRTRAAAAEPAPWLWSLHHLGGGKAMDGLLLTELRPSGSPPADVPPSAPRRPVTAARPIAPQTPSGTKGRRGSRTTASTRSSLTRGRCGDA